MDVRVLGPLQVGVPDAWTPIPARRQQLVFGVLLANAGTVLDGERLLHEAWGGEPPASGLQALRYHVSRLRTTLREAQPDGGPAPIETVGSGYRLLVAPHAIDAHRFEDLARRGARLVVDQHWDRAVEALDRALGLWRGDAWQDFRYEEFAQPAIHRLEERRVSCLEDRITARLGRGEHRDLVPELRELTTRHPLHEHFWAQAMVALSRAGRPAEAAATYEQARAVLDRELGSERASELARLRDRVAADSWPAAGRRADSRHTALPSRTSAFIGRHRDLARVHALLDRRRLVTVTGPGGVGKTSLALEAARMRDPEAGPVVLAELAPVAEPEEVAVEVVRALGVPDVAGRATLGDAVDHVGDGSLLLVVDNCEHVAATVARVARRLLADCAGLTVLATSRRALGVAGEHLHALAPMDLPDGEDDGVMRADAVQLFVDRASAARGRFAVTRRNRDLVVEVCRRLDALPLALELAAARLRHLAIDQLLELLQQPLDLRDGDHAVDPRHATLRAAMQWSHDLLSPRAAILLRRLAAFAGSFELAAVVAVCTDAQMDEEQVGDALAELVDMSLVQRGAHEDDPLTMLQTVREFAAERLESAGEVDVLRERHARCFADRVVRRPRYGSATQLGEARRIRVDGDNHAAALAWALRRERHELVLPLVAGAAHSWYATPHGNRHLQWLVDRIGRAGIAPTTEYAAALCTLGLSLAWMGRTDEAEVVAEALAAVADVLDTPEHRADLRWVRAALATVAGQVPVARDLFAEAVELLRRSGHPKLSVFLYDLAWREVDAGEAARAGETMEELEDVVQCHDQPLGRARIRLLEGWLAHHHGDQHAAMAATTSALADMRRMGMVGPQLDALRAVGWVAATAGSWARARSSALALRRLVAGNGEVVARPFADAVLALAAVDRGAPLDGARHVADGLAVMQRHGTSAGLDDILVAGAEVATAVGHHDRAAEWHAVRAARCRRLGLVDAAPVARLAARALGSGNGTPQPPVGGSDDQAAVTWALDAIAA